MSDSKNHTHVAVHAVVFNDAQGNRHEISPGTAFTPDKKDLAHLVAAGAVRKNVADAGAEVEGDQIDTTDKGAGKK